jgi:hypothetical protein
MPIRAINVRRLRAFSSEKKVPTAVPSCPKRCPLWCRRIRRSACEFASICIDLHGAPTEEGVARSGDPFRLCATQDKAPVQFTKRRARDSNIPGKRGKFKPFHRRRCKFRCSCRSSPSAARSRPYCSGLADTAGSHSTRDPGTARLPAVILASDGRRPLAQTNLAED